MPTIAYTVQPVPPYTSPPPTPDRSNPTNYDSIAYAWADSLKVYGLQIVALGGNVLLNTTEAARLAQVTADLTVVAAGSVTDAAGFAAAAAASATSAGSSAAVFDPAFAYPAGKTAYSPITYLAYRRKTAGTSATDPSADGANWVPQVGTQTVVVTGTAVTALADYRYELANPSLTTVTLPSAPVSGNSVTVIVGNGRTDNVIARNGKTINGLPEDATLNNALANVTLNYCATTGDWRSA